MKKSWCKRAYVPFTTVCPVCGRDAVMSLFKCRCANWYGYYAMSKKGVLSD